MSAQVDITAGSLLHIVFEGQQLVLKVLGDERLVAGLALVCILFSVVKIRALFVPFIKLAVVYYAIMAITLAAAYGHEKMLDLSTLRSLKQTAKGALWATAACFFLGLMTPKKARQGPKA